MQRLLPVCGTGVCGRGRRAGESVALMIRKSATDRSVFVSRGRFSKVCIRIGLLKRVQLCFDQRFKHKIIFPQS